MPRGTRRCGLTIKTNLSSSEQTAPTVEYKPQNQIQLTLNGYTQLVTDRIKQGWSGNDPIPATARLTTDDHESDETRNPTSVPTNPEQTLAAEQTTMRMTRSLIVFQSERNEVSRSASHRAQRVAAANGTNEF